MQQRCGSFEEPSSFKIPDGIFKSKAFSFGSSSIEVPRFRPRVIPCNRKKSRDLPDGTLAASRQPQGRLRGPLLGSAACWIRERARAAVARFGEFLFRPIEGIAAYCDDQVRFGVVDSINTPIKAVLRRARGMIDDEMLLLTLKWTTDRPIRSAETWRPF